jgi:hypothetical protein
MVLGSDLLEIASVPSNRIAMGGNKISENGLPRHNRWIPVPWCDWILSHWNARVKGIRSENQRNVLAVSVEIKRNLKYPPDRSLESWFIFFIRVIPFTPFRMG